MFGRVGASNPARESDEEAVLFKVQVPGTLKLLTEQHSQWDSTIAPGMTGWAHSVLLTVLIDGVAALTRTLGISSAGGSTVVGVYSGTGTGGVSVYDAIAFNTLEVKIKLIGGRLPAGYISAAMDLETY